jgi:hypothetical protein
MKKTKSLTLSTVGATAPAFEFFTPLGVDRGIGMNPPGLICAANESRFTSAHYSEPLTAYTVGWVDPENIDRILESMFPEVMVSRRFEFKKATNAQAFLSETDDIRPIDSPFKRVEYTGTSANEKTVNKGLTVRIDHDATEDVDGEVRVTVNRLQQRLLRNDLRRGITVLEANDATSGVIFSASTNPDGFARAMLKASADKTGIRPNVVVYGEAAYDLRADAYEAAANTSGYAGRAAAMTLADLAQKLMVDRVEVVKARYQSTATAKGIIVPSTMYAYLAISGMGKDDPSAVKRFTSKARGGQKFGVYVVVHEKFTDVSVEMYSNIVCTGLGIESRTVTNA